MGKIVQSLKINEIFYSLQGEGNRAGEPSIFIRLQGCSAKNACLKSGIECDTEFESGKEMNLVAIEDYIGARLYNTIRHDYRVKNNMWIVWTGGEPCDQLTEEIVEYFTDLGYKQAIETSGIKTPPKNLDYICLSPKVAEHVIEKKFKDIEIDEIRWVRSKDQEIPQTKLKSKYYYISPHSDGDQLNADNLKWCIELCKHNPKWRLSIQQHKIWNVR